MMNESTVTGAEILTERIGAGAVVALDSLGVIEVAGDDAREFLQGQFSNDIDALAAIDGDAGARCQLNAYCNPKGRALAVVRVLRLGDGWRLLAPAALADALMMRLRMFVLRAKVSVELQSRRGGELSARRCYAAKRCAVTVCCARKSPAPFPANSSSATRSHRARRIHRRSIRHRVALG